MSITTEIDNIFSQHNIPVFNTTHSKSKRSFKITLGIHGKNFNTLVMIDLIKICSKHYLEFAILANDWNYISVVFRPKKSFVESSLSVDDISNISRTLKQKKLSFYYASVDTEDTFHISTVTAPITYDVIKILVKIYLTNNKSFYFTVEDHTHLILRYPRTIEESNIKFKKILERASTQVNKI